MNKVELGQLLYVNGLDMNEVKSELNPRITIEDGQVNSIYLRPEVEQLIRRIKGSYAVLTLKTDEKERLK